MVVAAKPGRPVKWTESRSEGDQVMIHGPTNYTTSTAATRYGHRPPVDLKADMAPTWSW